MLLLFMAMPETSSGEEDSVLENCIVQIANHKKQALAQLYDRTHAAVYGFALSLLQHRQDAEDVMHDVYLQVWRYAKDYQPKGKPMAWLFTITRNLALMRIRQQRKTIPVSPEDWHTIFADAHAADHTDRLLLGALLTGLTDEERQIVVLHAMTGLKHREIADLLNLKLSTVLSKYHRAIKKLRQEMQNFVEGGGQK